MMRLRLHTFRSALATGLSVWLAVLACVMGCTLPNLAGSTNTSVTYENSIAQNQPDVMAQMPNCPHRSDGNAPAKRNRPMPVRWGMSCCPVEVTVASKPDTGTLCIAGPAIDFVPASYFTLTIVRTLHSTEIVSPIRHSGRDTLRETQLLRI
jgi:hypothetical protein